MRSQSFENWRHSSPHPKEPSLSRCSVEAEGICFMAASLVELCMGTFNNTAFAMGRWELAKFLKGISQTRSAGRWTGELQRIQLSDFLSCSFEVSPLNRKKKNNPLCQPFVAQSLLFPVKSKENGQDSFCPESICVFYIGLSFEALIVKWEKRQRFPSNLRKSKGEFLKLSGLTQNSPGWHLQIYTPFATELSMEISTGSQNDKN